MSLELKIPKMACSACVNTITKAVTEIDANAKVEADPKTKIVRVETNQSEAAIKSAIASVGYPAA